MTQLVVSCVEFSSVVVLTASETRTLCLGIAQLIPVFLIALFVLDNAWIKKAMEDNRRETLEILEAITNLNKRRLDAISSIENSLREIDGYSESLNRRKFIIRKRQQQAIAQTRTRLARMRVELSDAEKNFKSKASLDEAKSRSLRLLREYKAELKARIRGHNRILIFNIILGMAGELTAIWGMVGLSDNSEVITLPVICTICIAGTLSLLSIGRLTFDAPSRASRIVMWIWMILICGSIAGTGYWIAVSVRIKN